MASRWQSRSLYNRLAFTVLFATLVFLGCKTGSDSSSKAIFDSNGNRIPDDMADSDQVSWRHLHPNDGFSGIGVLNYPFFFSDYEICTTFFVATGPDSAPAYFFTNAHCTLHALSWSPLGPQEVRLNQRTRFSVVLNHFRSVPKNKRVKVPLKSLVYVTEHGTDLAIFQSSWTIGQLKSRGFNPIKISSSAAQDGDEVSLTGIPLTRIAGDDRTLFTSTCKIKGIVALKNGEYSAPNSRIHQCNSVEGFSGGPLIRADSKEVLLINSHGAADDSTDADCSYASRPCEQTGDGWRVNTNHNYAQHLKGIDACFTEAGQFSLQNSACTLPRP